MSSSGQILHQTVGLIRVPELRLVEQPVFSGDVRGRRLCLREHLDGERSNDGSESHRVIHGPLGRTDQHGCDPVLGDLREAGVEIA